MTDKIEPTVDDFIAHIQKGNEACRKNVLQYRETKRFDEETLNLLEEHADYLIEENNKLIQQLRNLASEQS